MNSTYLTMKNEEISRLIRKFYDGTSTEEEEKILRALFSVDQAPEGFETEKELICSFMAMGRIEGPSSDLEEKILTRIDESGKKSFEINSRKRFILILSSAAAVILLMIGTYFFLESRSRYWDTYSDPELAYNETMKILMDVSVRLNKGTNALEPVSKLNTMTDMSIEKISESSSLINKSFRKLNNLGKVLEEKRIGKTGVINK